jgi:hypothetical protein
MSAFAEVPAELRELPRWIVWRWGKLDPKTGKRKKPPYCPGDLRRHASSTDPTTWGTFEQVVELLDRGKADGIGYAAAPPYVFIDLDEELSEADRGAIMVALDSYSERSPSGTGYHVVVTASLNGRGRHPQGIGVFQEARFFYFTGEHVPGTPTTIEERQAQLERVLAEFLPPLEPVQPRAASVPVDLKDEELLERARSAKNGAKFDALWRGDASGYGSQSEADLALCGMLAFWTGGDPGRLDRLFRSSGLMREKWERADYRERTVAAAISSCAEFYEPSKPTALVRHPTSGRDQAGEAYEGPARALSEVVETFESWLYLPDSTIVLVALATVAANLLEGSPLWTLLVAPPGAGKTETLQAISSLPDVYPTAVLTEAALLSGSPNRERAKGAKGGLLRELGDFGIVVAKDFGSVLSMRHDGRGEVLAALREVFDGAWTRHVGTDGGRTLSWSGKVGLLAGCTPTIDRHHQVMAQMGERFVLFRHRPGDRRQQALSTLRHSGKREKAMRGELAQAVRGLFASGLPRQPRELSDEEAEQIAALASFVTLCRSAVERDAYSREIELVSDAEAPTRLASELERLLAGLDALGLDRKHALEVVGRAARDSMPALRAQLLDVLGVAGGPITTSAVAEEVGYPTQTARRALEDLTAHGVVMRYPQGKGKADLWALDTVAKDDLRNLSRFSFFYSEGD